MGVPFTLLVEQAFPLIFANLFDLLNPYIIDPIDFVD